MTTSTSVDSARGAGPFGRVLRIAAGILLMGSIAGFYLDGTLPFVIRSAAVAIGLVSISVVLHRRVVADSLGTRPWLGAIVALAPLLLVYLLGMSGGPIFGGGEGQLGALTYLGVSLVLAGLSGDGGCEVMAVPNVLSAKKTRLACLVFSPIDRLEQRLSKHLTRS